MKLSQRYLHTFRAAMLAIVLLTVSAAHAQEIYRMESEPAAAQLRTNGLFDLALCPNIGFEIQTDIGIGFQLDYTGAWWNSHARNRYYSNYGLQTELRYYFGHKGQQMPYTKHHAGAYFQMLTYDFEFGGKGYQSRDLDMTVGFGLSYGYVIPLNKHFSFDMTVGIGYFSSKYYLYEPYGDWYRATNYKRMRFFGPTKLEATLVWNLNKRNNK